MTIIYMVSIITKLQEKWIKLEHIATFIYVRAIKIPFLFAMILYFWIKYTIILNVVILCLAILMWQIFNLFNNYLKNEK